MATATDTPTGTDLTGASPSHAFRWLVTRVGTRIAAAIWCGVMVFFAVLVVDFWLDLARNPTPANIVFTVGVTAVVGIPLVHEWTHVRCMARMLVRGV